MNTPTHLYTLIEQLLLSNNKSIQPTSTKTIGTRRWDRNILSSTGSHFEKVRIFAGPISRFVPNISINISAKFGAFVAKLHDFIAMPPHYYDTTRVRDGDSCSILLFSLVLGPG